MKILPAIVGSVLAGLSPASLVAASEKNDTLMLLGGNEAALVGFEKAAIKCGLNGVSRIPKEGSAGTWVRVGGSMSEIRSKPLDCATRYLLSHMEGENALSFIGNAPL